MLQSMRAHKEGLSHANHCAAAGWQKDLYIHGSTVGISALGQDLALDRGFLIAFMQPTCRLTMFVTCSLL